MSDYPEHDKLREIAPLSQAIGEFLDYGPYTLCEYKPEPEGVPRYIDTRTGTDRTPRDRPVSWSSDYTITNPAWYPAGLYAVQTPLQQILATHFGIDLAKIDAEKAAMLEALRSANGPQAAKGG